MATKPKKKKIKLLGLEELEPEDILYLNSLTNNEIRSFGKKCILFYEKDDAAIKKLKSLENARCGPMLDGNGN